MEEVKAMMLKIIDEHGYTQKQLALEIDLTKEYVNGILNGRIMIKKRYPIERMKVRLQKLIDKDIFKKDKRNHIIAQIQKILDKEE